jgi:hypothetical protein
MSFKKNKYTVLKNAISPEIAEFVYKYFLNKRNVARFLFDQKYISPFTEYFGVWNDSTKFLILIHIIVTLQWKLY